MDLGDSTVDPIYEIHKLLGTKITIHKLDFSRETNQPPSSENKETKKEPKIKTIRLYYRNRVQMLNSRVSNHNFSVVGDTLMSTKGARWRR